ncbi:MAG: acyl--CoA ligase [Syntrophales bacterium]|jgi:acyl-CoA synthetase (AMP-forming)/AMP-acid ligase II|nr:acyl--CoA ligase [Syntrophales bacterium]MDY0043601.1 class I adenylate-forming enzyme family protein [Syntrophales bacterium]
MIKSMEDVTIGNLFEKNLKLFPDKTIQVFDGGKRQTYREMEERANRLANGLLDLGLKKGDHVAILAMNCPEYMEYQLATAKIGIVSVLINNLMPSDRIAYMLDHSDSQAVIFEDQYAEAVGMARENASKLKHFIMIERGNKPDINGIDTYEDLIRRSSDKRPEIDVKIMDPNSLLYTTGTTGMPKGVLKSMAADMYHPLTGIIYYPNYDATHKLGLPAYNHLVSLLIGPQFHLGGQSFTLIPLISPATLVLTRKFEPEKFLKLIHEEKINSTWIQPAMLYEIKKLPAETLKKYDVSSLVAIICGSTTLKAQEKKDLLDFFSNATLGSNYASTEFATASYVSQEELDATRPDNLGVPSLAAEIMIADEEGNELPVNEVGHIWVRTPALPINCEYYKNEEATRQGFRNGWAIVGDTGWRDEKGYFYYYGRGDDIIKSGGEKVSPLPIEEIIQQNPKVNAAVVVGIPDDKWQEVVTAVVVPKKGEDITETEVIELCKEKVASYERPKKVYFVKELPLGTTGKVDRKSLKKMIQEHTIT